VNHITITGNAGADAKEVQTRSGVKMAAFSIAVTEKRGDEKVTFWLDVTCFKWTADFALSHVFKGTKVMVCGKLEKSVWTSRDGQERESVRVTAWDVAIIPRVDRADGGGDPQSGARRGMVSTDEMVSRSRANEGDDVPF